MVVRSGVMAATATRPFEFSNDRQTIVDPDGTGELLLQALGDEDCRSILRATSSEALSTNELSEACDLPLSTAYRKLERLADAGLVEERLRLRRSGKHTAEYVRCVDGLHVSIDDQDGVALAIEQSDA